MELRPLADRVWIKPDATPTQTESGIHLVEDWHPEQSGTVIAVGLMTHPRKAEAEKVAERVEAVVVAEGIAQYVEDDCKALIDAAELLRDLTSREPQVKAGDRVLFSYESGQQITIDDDTRYFMMRERDILAVIEPEEAHG